MNVKKIAASFAVCAAMLASVASADTVSVSAKVKKILASETNFGGCMVELTVSPQNQLPACNANWVTLSCDGTHVPQTTARRLLDQAQISYALDKVMTVFIDDSRRINGYCLAFRIDLN